MSKQTNHFYEFGPFRVDAGRQLLLRDGQPVPLTSKTFETLLMLLQHSEQMVSKDELMKQLWPDTFVEESNLTYHISMLRKALGESPQDHRYLVTIAGRGYRFAEKVREVSDGYELVVQSHSVERVTVEETESRQHSAAVASFSNLRERPWHWILGATGAVALLTLAAAGTFFYKRNAHALTEKDTIVLSDFANTTGDAVFDGALSNLPRAPTGVLALHVQDVVLHLERKLMGIAI
jgi:DNA-binding winged helix-turn-helix (wHTH) protein